MTNKLLIPQVLFLTANNGTLPVTRAIMDTCGETVYGGTDNPKTEQGKFPIEASQKVLMKVFACARTCVKSTFQLHVSVNYVFL